MVDAIAEDMRESLVAYFGEPVTPNIDMIRDTIMKTMPNAISVEIDPDNPDVVIITWERPKFITLSLELDLMATDD